MRGMKGRVRKIAKWKPDSDDESYEESECKYKTWTVSLIPWLLGLDVA